MDFFVKIQSRRKKGWIFLLKSLVGVKKLDFFVKSRVGKKKNGILVESLQSRKFENHLNPFSVTASLIDVGRYQSADNTNYCS